MRRFWILGVAFLWACGADGPAAETGPEDLDAFVAADSARIMEELRFLSLDSLEGRRTGEPGNLIARDFILEAFREAGLQAPPAGFVQAFEFRGRRDPTAVFH